MPEARGARWVGYSQGGEDLLLRDLFGSVGHTYVDVGAFDGVHLSNTYLLELLGWPGVCIEANPQFGSALRRSRPRAKSFMCAVGAEEGKATLAVDATGLRASIERGDSWEDEAVRAARVRGVKPEVREVSVEVRTLDSVLTRARVVPPIGVLSIDVEGAESLVLDGFTIEAWRPLVLIVEGNSEDERDEHAALLKPHGYRLARRVGVNEFYTGTPTIARVLEAADVEGVLIPTKHPFGDAMVHPDLRTPRMVKLRPPRSREAGASPDAMRAG